MPRRPIAGIGLLLLTSGCYSHIAGGAADLPRPRLLPTIPDAGITAREPHPRWMTGFDAALARDGHAPLVGWTFFAGLIAF